MFQVFFDFMKRPLSQVSIHIHGKDSGYQGELGQVDSARQVSSAGQVSSARLDLTTCDLQLQ